MTRKIVLLTICKNIVWKETAKYLKHYRMKSKWDMNIYNIYVSALIDMYRKTEFEINNKDIRYTKFEYIEKIKKLEVEILEKLAKDK